MRQWLDRASAHWSGSAVRERRATDVVAQLPAGDGGWDLPASIPSISGSISARPDGVTAIDLKTGKATDRIVPGQRVHAALAIPGTHEVLSTNGETNNATSVRRPDWQGSRDDRDRHQARRRRLRSGDADGVDHESRKRRHHGRRSGERQSACDGPGRRLARAWRRRRQGADVRQRRGQERSRRDRHAEPQAAVALSRSTAAKGRRGSPTMRRRAKSFRHAATTRWRSCPRRMGGRSRGCRSAKARTARRSTPSAGSRSCRPAATATSR